MKRYAALAVVCTALAACGGGGGTSGSAIPGQSTPAPHASGTPGVATPPPLSSFAFHVIGIGGTKTMAVAPLGATVTLPSGYAVGSPAPYAVITYPDGTSQQADQNGVFTPSASSYATTYASLLQSSAFAQPIVKVADAQGAAVGSAQALAPYASAPTGTARLGGVTVQPDVAQLFPGEIVTLIATPTDVDDRITNFGNAQLTWASANGATITPIPGTNQATYVAPTLSSGTQSDIVTASASVPGLGFAYTATANITTIAPTSAFAVSGALLDANGKPVPGASAIFVASDAPRAYKSFNFTALADANGNYQRDLPANAEFALALAIPSATGPSLFPGILAGGATSLQSGSGGTSGSANIQASPTGAFDDAKDDAKNAIPDPILGVRDGWLAHAMTRVYPFWADSGVLALLANAHTDGAPPTSVGAGLLARWCYQWQARGGVDTLVLIENANASCSAPGNDAFEVSASGSNAYAFTHYRRVSGAYTLGATLDDATGAQLVATGTWTQDVTNAGASISGDTASVTIDRYGAVSQTLSAPVSHLTMQYAYTGSGTVTIAFSNAVLVDPVTGVSLASASGSLTQQASPATCAGASTACYAGALTIVRSLGGASQTFASRDTVDGDGSSLDVVTNTAVDDASSVSFPVASASARAAGSCVICAANLGSLLDADGASQLGSFTLSAAGVSTFELLSTVDGGGPGTPLVTFDFPVD